MKTKHNKTRPLFSPLHFTVKIPNPDCFPILPSELEESASLPLAGAAGQQLSGRASASRAFSQSLPIKVRGLGGERPGRVPRSGLAACAPARRPELRTWTPGCMLSSPFSSAPKSPSRVSMATAAASSSLSHHRRPPGSSGTGRQSSVWVSQPRSTPLS